MHQSAATPTTIVYVPNAPQEVPAPPAGQAFAGLAFELDAYLDGNPIPDFAVEQPVALTVNYADADIGDLSEETLALYRWVGNEWEQIGSAAGEILTLDVDNNLLTARLRRFSRFGMFGTAVGGRLFLPLVLNSGTVR